MGLEGERKTYGNFVNFNINTDVSYLKIYETHRRVENYSFEVSHILAWILGNRRFNAYHIFI